MKKVIMVRHARKIGEVIDPVALAEIRRQGIPALRGVAVNRIHAGSEFVRTRQTVEAYMAWLEGRGSKVQLPALPADSKLGSEEMFGEILQLPNIMNEMKKGPSQFGALKRVASSEQFRRWSKSAWDALLGIFDQIDDGDVCLSVGHTPLIEMVANVHLNWQLPEETALKELEGFSFEQSEDGAIMVSRL